MKKLIALGAFILLMLFWGCTLRTDEKHAVHLIEKELSIPGDLTARKLGGASEASVFLITGGPRDYVVKLFKGKNGECEIYNSKIASDCGYGPMVYYSDSSQGALINEFLQGKKVSLEDLRSDTLYVTLAQLLQKIHQGKEFKNSGFDVFKRIDRDIQNNKIKCDEIIPLLDIQHLVDVIHKALLPHLARTPCHNDLHRGNLVFLGHEFKAIDYGDASPGDPYFDIATVADAYFMDSAHDTILLTTYLKREPSPAEKAKLYLMKQIVFVKWACDRLRSLSRESLQRYGFVQIPSIRDFFQRSLEGKVDLERNEDCLQCLKINFDVVLKNSESQEFKEAVALLTIQGP